jgi:hypothetical protein
MTCSLKEQSACSRSASLYLGREAILRCLFCKKPTSDSEPIEHVLPESIGNKDHVLKRGLVCGKCNNYFASKVEKKFLELFEIESLRFNQLIPSKKGRIPIMRAFTFPFPSIAEVTRDPESGQMSVNFAPEVVKHIMNAKGGKFILPLPS